MADEHLPIFVYGTLKRGQERSALWPHAPLRVDPATTTGVLRDLGPYPALLDGDRVVAGELWHVRAEHVAETLRVLNEIEGYANEDVDLYVRRVVNCRTADGSEHRAYAYFFADPKAAERAPTCPTNDQGQLEWTSRQNI